MRNEYTAILALDEGWFMAYSPEIPGANGQGRTKDEALQCLRSAIALILEDPRSCGTGANSRRDGFSRRDGQDGG